MRLKSKENSRTRLLRTVMEEGFAVDEARLYLDTHPESKKAQSYFDRHNEARRKDGWTWIDPPFPWEGDEN